MKTLGRFLTVITIGVFASALAFGQSSVLTTRNLSHNKSIKAGRKRGFQPSTDAISAANLNNYYLGYDFVMSRNLIGGDDPSKCLSRLTILWDELEGQPEVGQIETLMKMVVRGYGTVEDRLAKLDAAQVAVELRIKGDQKWFYSLGKSYTKLSFDLEAKDSNVIRARMVELGKLGQSAPTTVPPAFAAALVKIGVYAAKSSLSDDDVAVVTAQFETIDKILTA